MTKWTQRLVLLMAVGALSLSPLMSALAYPKDSTMESQGDLQKLLEKTKEPKDKRPNWNKNHYNWEEHKNQSTGKVDVILYLDSEDLNRLDKQLQKQLNKEKKRTYSLAFPGLSASLAPDIIDSILYENPKIQIQPDTPVSICINVNQTGADAMWNRTDDLGIPVKGSGIIVAILDTGIDYNHPALGAGFGPTKRVIGGWDYINNDANPMDDHGHGTHCTGIVGANGTAFGVAPEVSFYALKVLNAAGSGSFSTIIAGMEWAMDPNDDGDTSDHADVISMSIGGSGTPGDAACIAVESAVDAGVVVCVAAGNLPVFGRVSTPGLAESAITVGATDSTGALASFSSRGEVPYGILKPDICAPGVNVYSTYLYSGWRSMSGTSMATPHVAGACALLLQVHPEWAPQRVKSAIMGGANFTDISLWEGGAGQVFVPSASDLCAFSEPQAVSLVRNWGTEFEIAVNSSVAAIYTVAIEDYFSMSSSMVVNGTMPDHTWHTNLTTVTEANLDLDAEETGYLHITVPEPTDDMLEGYYQGRLVLNSTSSNLSVQFGFINLALVTVRPIDICGVAITGLKLADMLMVNSDDPSIFYGTNRLIEDILVMSAFVQSGNYSVRSSSSWDSVDDGHSLSKDVIIYRKETKSVYLTASTAKKFIIPTTTPDGDVPIWVSDYGYCWRYSNGTYNLSWDYFVTDLDMMGAETLTAPKQTEFYASPTNDSMGLYLMGFSSSEAMHRFWLSNNDHWFGNISAGWLNWTLGSSADRMYILAWEFRGINDTAVETLNINWSLATTLDAHSTLPGNASDPWLNYGYYRNFGGMYSMWERRDASSIIEPMMIGLNRSMTVQGTHSVGMLALNLTHPMHQIDLWNYDDAQFVPTTTSGIYMADRNYYTPLELENQSIIVGGAPAYVCARMNNTNTSFVLQFPIVKNSDGQRVVNTASNQFQITRGASLVMTGTMSDGVIAHVFRVFSLSMSGTYFFRYYPTFDQMIGNRLMIEWRIAVPNIDRSPPYIEDLNVPMKFSPGDSFNISMDTADDLSAVSAIMAWRDGPTDSWHYIAPTEDVPGLFNITVATLATTVQVDYLVNISDATGNYLNYSLQNASRAQLIVDFDLGVLGGIPDIPYQDTEATITLLGNLTCGGQPLDPKGAIPLDLYVGEKKIATILDQWVEGGTAFHNGSIRFDWDLNPLDIFTGPNEYANITCWFDIGTYQALSQNFTLHSVVGADIPPVISLYSPLNDSEIVNGTYIDIDALDESLIEVNYTLDGGANATLAYPDYYIDTSAWSDGYHDVSVFGRDSNTTTWKIYRFNIDNKAPVVTITSPLNGTSLLNSSVVVGTISDNSSIYAYWSLEDGDYLQDYPYTYLYSLSSLGPGWYNLTLVAYDKWGHVAEDKVNFNITSENPVIQNSPGLSVVIYDEYYFNATSTAADSGANVWTLLTNATFLNLNYTDATHGMVNGTPESSYIGWYWVNVSVADGDTSDYVNFTLEVEGLPPPPFITSMGPAGFLEDHDIAYQATADQGVTWSLTSNCTNLSINAVSGLVSGIVNNSYSEWEFWMNVTCTNANGSAFQNVTIRVWNLAPAFTPDLGIPPVTGTVDWPISYNANHSDEGIGIPLGDYEGITTNFTGAYTFDTTNGWLNFTPSYSGELWFNITADDGRGVANSTSWQNWSMMIAEEAPYIVSSPVASTTVWDSFFFNCTATPPDLGATTWVYSSNATWLSFVWGNQTRYNVSGTPVVLGSYWVNFSANDSESDHYLNFTLTVEAGTPPSFTSSPPLTAYEDSLYFYLPVCDQLIDTWQLLFNNATWATWSAVNGSFTGTPLNNVTRYYFSMYISATNVNGTVWQNWWVAVANRVPVFSTSPIISAVNNTAYSYNSTTDDEGLNATYSVNSNATFAYNVHLLSGELTFTPDLVGYIWVNITCDDGSLAVNATWYQNFTVTISLSSPLIQIAPTYTVVIWVLYEYHSTCTSPDSGATTWGLVTNATWLVIVSGGSGFNVCNLSGTPIAFGIFWANLTVNDTDTLDYVNWTITILAGPLPTFTSSPDTGIHEDNLYFYAPTADQPVTWALVLMDGTWLSFDPLTGQVDGIPDNVVSEQSFNVQISIITMNGTTTQSWAVFVYNNAPLITSTPDPNATQGIPYFYNCASTDESVGTTTYSVTTNYTGWYNLNATSGGLTITSTFGGAFYFNLTFDDGSGVGNSTTFQNFTLFIIAVSPVPSASSPVGSTGSAWVSYRYVVIGLEVQLSYNCYGDVVSYHWDFGDGTGSNERNPTHRYSLSGTYTVTLTIIDSTGRNAKATTQITVQADTSNPIEPTNEGWNIWLTETLVLSISSVGLGVTGAIFVMCAHYNTFLTIFTRRGSWVIGWVMIGGCLFYYIFVNDSLIESLLARLGIG